MGQRKLIIITDQIKNTNPVPTCVFHTVKRVLERVGVLCSFRIQILNFLVYLEVIPYRVLLSAELTLTTFISSKKHIRVTCHFSEEIKVVNVSSAESRTLYGNITI